MQRYLKDLVMCGLLVCVTFILTLADCCHGCGYGWVANDAVGACYRINVVPRRDWENAKAYCYLQLDEDTELAYLKDYTEQMFVKEHLVKNITGTGVWLGGNDKKSEGDWRWIGAAIMDINKFKWLPGNPDDHGSGEDCLQMRSGSVHLGLLNDNDCGKELPFVCKSRDRYLKKFIKSSSTSTTPTTTTTAATTTVTTTTFMSSSSDDPLSPIPAGAGDTSAATSTDTTNDSAEDSSTVVTDTSISTDHLLSTKSSLNTDSNNSTDFYIALIVALGSLLAVCVVLFVICYIRKRKPTDKGDVQQMNGQSTDETMSANRRFVRDNRPENQQSPIPANVYEEIPNTYFWKHAANVKPSTRARNVKPNTRAVLQETSNFELDNVYAFTEDNGESVRGSTYAEFLIPDITEMNAGPDNSAPYIDMDKGNNGNHRNLPKEKPGNEYNLFVNRLDSKPYDKLTHSQNTYYCFLKTPDGREVAVLEEPKGRTLADEPKSLTRKHPDNDPSFPKGEKADALQMRHKGADGNEYVQPD